MLVNIYEGYVPDDELVTEWILCRDCAEAHHDIDYVYAGNDGDVCEDCGDEQRQQ